MQTVERVGMADKEILVEHQEGGDASVVVESDDQGNQSAEVEVQPEKTKVEIKEEK
jgi:hypothetical protein